MKKILMFLPCMAILLTVLGWTSVKAEETYYLDVNGVLDGSWKANTEQEGKPFARVDVYINDSLIGTNQTDCYSRFPEGTKYKVIYTCEPGYHFSNHENINVFEGTLPRGGVSLAPSVCTNHKLTIKYHNDGATKWNSIVDNANHNISADQDVLDTDVFTYGDLYDEYWGLANVSRLSKDGYHSDNRWYVGQKGSELQLRDDIGYKYIQDLADAAGLLQDFDKQDVTLDLYPYLIPDDGHQFTVKIYLNDDKLVVGDSSIELKSDGTALFHPRYNTSYYYKLGLQGVKDGYVFTKITDAKDGGNDLYTVNWTEDGIAIDYVKGKYWDEHGNWIYDGDVISYCQYRLCEYTIQYDSNGGAGIMEDSHIVFDSKDGALRKNVFAKDGYTFNGWNMSRQNGDKTEWLYGNTDGSWISAKSWYEEGKNPKGTSLYKVTDQQTFNKSNYIDGCVLTAHAQWSYNQITVNVPQTLIGDSNGNLTFMVSSDLAAGNIDISVPESFVYKQSGKSDIAAKIKCSKGDNKIDSTNKICTYEIKTDGLTAGCWNGTFNIGLKLTK